MTRHRVKLSRAWITHWDTLFPNNSPWHETLESWVILNLKYWNEGEFLTEAKKVSQQAVNTDWAHTLSVAVEDAGLIVRVGGDQEIRGPLFADELIACNPSWAPPNPLQKWIENEKPGQDRYLRKEATALVRNVTLRVGARIQQRLLDALREDKLSVWGLAGSDPFVRSTKVPTEQLTTGMRASIPGIEITLSNGVRIRSATVGPGNFFKNTGTKSRSFAATDEPLIEEMNKLLRSEQASSIRNAAEMVVDRAKKRGKTESAVERLQKRYSRKYPSK